MLSALFDRITRGSLRFSWITIILALLLLALGVLAVGDLNQELVPRIEFPQTIVIAQWPDAEDAEQFLDEVTIPLEEAVADIDGVVNVESTTNPGFGVIIVRNEFGLNQDRIVSDIETALDEVALPEGMETPEILNFSLSDLPIVTASVSSAELSLAELKAIVQEELIPELEQLEQVSQVTVGGGQELPDEIEADEIAAQPEEVVAEEVAEEPEPTPVPTPEPTADPAALPEEMIAAFAQGGQDVATVGDLTPDLIRLITDFGPLADQIFALLTPANLRLMAPESLALLPTSFRDTLAADLAAELDEIALEYGGVSGTYEAELAAAAEAEAQVADLPMVEPQPLPQSWIDAAAAAGQTLETTADLDALVAGGIVEFAPQLVADLEPAQWRALHPEVIGILMPVAEEMDPVLTAQLVAITDAANGIPPEAVPLPDEIIEAAAGAGQTLESSADITVEALELLSTFAPELLVDAPVELIYALSPAHLAVLPADFISSLDEDVQQTVANIFVWDAVYQASLVAEPPQADDSGEPEPTPEPVDPARLPDVLIGAAAQFGVEIEFAQDITPDFMRLIGAAGEQATAILGLMTPDNLRLLQPEVIGLLPAGYLDTLDAGLRAELDELAAEFGGAGQLAIQEAEERAAASAEAPPLAGIWLEPDDEGNPPLFLTAADILNNNFMPGAAAFLNVFPTSPDIEDPRDWMGALSIDVIQYLADNEADFVANLDLLIVELMAPETIQYMLDNFPDAFDEEAFAALSGIAAGTVEVFVPEASIVRTNGNPALVLNVFKDGDANTVVVSERVFEFLDEFASENAVVDYRVVFEQATFIEQAIEGVTGEASRGAIVAIFIILIFLSGRVKGRFKLSWRAVIVTGVSIPLSIMTAIFLGRWVPTVLGEPMSAWAQSSGSDVIRFISRLFPTEFTLNILTLSGLTVAIGRVVDDSIVVLENSYRYIQQGIEPRKATIMATKEVAIAIFAATATTMAVFLPLGLVGGLISSFFLPFGLTVAYALAASFLVSITVVPVLTMLLIRPEHIPEHRETTMQRWYTPVLEWGLRNRLATLLIALVLFVGSVFLLGTLPQSFIPSLGEPTVNINVELPSGTKMTDTDTLVQTFEETVLDLEGVTAVQTEIGGAGGFEALFGGGSVAQNVANMQVAVEERFILDQESLGSLTIDVREQAEEIFGVDNVVVGAGVAGDFGGGLALNLKGADADDLAASVDDVKDIITAIDLDANGAPDVVNLISNVDDVGSENGAASIIRIDGEPAVSITGAYEFGNQNTIGVVQQALLDIDAAAVLPSGATVSEGFDSQQQTEGFQGIVTAIGIASVLVYLIMALSFRSLVHPFTILFSLPLSLIGAALALFLTDRVLGISSMIGLLMLVGIVTTNGIVLMEFVKQLREEGKPTYEALVEGGRTRLRPIWMTALATILALVPLAISSEAGAIIAADLAWTVLGGMLVSTLLTLVVVPVVYSVIDEAITRVNRRLRPNAA